MTQQLSEEELERVAELIYRRTGMVFGESKRYYIERRIADLRRHSGQGNFAAWLAQAKGDQDTLEALINAFTVNETYFYREEHQLACLSHSILPEIVKTKGPGDRIRIWSNPCSTGEEAYSIAIWLLEHWHLVDAYNVEIIGSDIDTKALTRAANGIYGERALARLTKPLVDQYFEKLSDGDHQLIKDMRESVIFTPANLVESSSLIGQGAFDIIFCRNVLIYFDDASRARAVDNLYAALQPGGFILLGHTESMSRITDRFETVRFDEGVVYRRPFKR